MRPGLSGWAQVCAPYASSIEDSDLKLSYDLYYLSHFSTWLDLVILLRTVKTVLKAGGRAEWSRVFGCANIQLRFQCPRGCCVCWKSFQAVLGPIPRCSLQSLASSPWQRGGSHPVVSSRSHQVCCGPSEWSRWKPTAAATCSASSRMLRSMPVPTFKKASGLPSSSRGASSLRADQFSSANTQASPRSSACRNSLKGVPVPQQLTDSVRFAWLRGTGGSWPAVRGCRWGGSCRLAHRDWLASS